MDWLGSAIWWHCYPLRFVGAEERAEDRPEGEPTHRLRQLTNWLDYLIELGCNGLMLAPVFASTSHGYDTLDHFRIDPRLGDDADFDDLMSNAKERGIGVCLDGVFNHVSGDHQIVARALAAGAESEEGRWLKWDDGHPICFEGNLDLVELNLAHPPVVDYIAGVMGYWLGRGIDGWRLDAAFAPGPAPWRPIIERVKAAYPRAWIVAEVIHADYGEFVAASGVDSLTQYELWKATWSSLNDANFHELAWTLQRHAQFSASFRAQTFLGNHDVTRIATKLTDPRHLRLAVAILMTLPGIPSIYAGDEQGFTGEKLDQPHGDDAVRPRFPQTPSQLSVLGAETLAVYQDLVAFRRDHSWLVDADLTTSDVTNTSIAIHLSKDQDHLTLALNTGDQPAQVGGLTVAPHSYTTDP